MAAGGGLPRAYWSQAGEDCVFRGSGGLGEDVGERVPGGGHEHVVADEVAAGGPVAVSTGALVKSNGVAVRGAGVSNAVHGPRRTGWHTASSRSVSSAGPAW